jgi:pimeloyl-ACP methyl ester carboxylesterase
MNIVGRSACLSAGGLSPKIHSRALSHFRVIEHCVPAQHTRHYPGGAEPGYHNSLQLSVKQYVPKSAAMKSATDAVTIIGAHGNGLPKELFEPFWDDFYERMRAKGRSIRSIWVADQAHQGQSGVLNEQILGDDPSWFDHARDLLFLINLMQEAMPQPLFGVGHSMGASQLVHLALLHPALLQGLVLLDPVLQTANPGKPYGRASTYRREVWPSREQARESFAKSKFYQAWDSRVLDKWVEYGLRDLPTEVFPDVNASESESPVTLTTAKHNEVHSFLRPLYKADVNGSDSNRHPAYTDLDPRDYEPDYPFYRPEPAILFRRLHELKPPVQYIFGRHSPLSGAELNEQRLILTGSGVGGSGGRSQGRVSAMEIDCGHFIPMEEPNTAAAETAQFIDREFRRWGSQKVEFEAQWRRKPRPARVTLDDEWYSHIGPKGG